MQNEASKYSLSAALIQCGRPITFARKTPTDIEICYTNIKRECLSVCCGPEKFCAYQHSRHAIIENDHKPLEMIQHKLIHTGPRRFQCMQKYHYTIQYKPSKDMILANHLSQFSSAKESLPIPILQKSSMCNYPPMSWMLSDEPSNMTQSTAVCTSSPLWDGLTASG